ncbi:MAG: hypothetical protein GYB67_08925 [Chloroflexi bacterium]|nr:hypothetical protein [Chloroflexota bacterium]
MLPMLLLITALPLAGLYLLPYDDGGLRAFFAATDDCASPCWQGITPGETTIDEVNAIMAAHPWIDALIGFDWWWSDAAPPFVDAEYARGAVWGVQNRVIGYLRLYSLSRLANVLITYGRPDGGRLRTDESIAGVTMVYELTYDALPDHVMTVFGRCPFDVGSLAELRVTHELGDIMAMYLRYGFPPDPMPDGYNLPEVLHTYCADSVR